MKQQHTRISWITSLVWAAKFYKVLADSYTHPNEYRWRLAFSYYQNIWSVFECAIKPELYLLSYPHNRIDMPNTEKWIFAGHLKLYPKG